MTTFDTDTLSLFQAGSPRVVERHRHCHDAVSVTVVTRIESLRGRFDALVKAADGPRLRQAQDWLRRTEEFLSAFPVLPVDDASAAIFDRLRTERKLRSIGRADLLIACICLAHEATLVTRNLRHFRAVPGLTVENWAD